jgi:signal transduction histidine kinase
MVRILRWRDLPWAFKLGTMLVVLAIVPLAMVTLYEETATRWEVRAESRARNLQRAQTTAALISRYLSDVVADVTILAQAPAAIRVLEGSADETRRTDLQTTLASMQATKGLEVLFVLDHGGTIVSATDPSAIGGSQSSTPFFLSAIAGQTRVHEPRYLAEDRQVHTHVAVPVRGAGGRIIGAAVARTSLDQVDRLIAGDSGFGGLDEQGALWDERGIVLSSPARPERRFRPLGQLLPFTRDRLIAEQRFGPETARLVSAAGAGDSLVEHSRWRLYDERANPHTAVDLGEGLLQVTSVPLTGERWTYAIAVSDAKLRAVGRAQSRRNVAAAFAAGIVALVLAVGAAKWLSQPLSQVGDAARALAAGDMTHRARLDRRDEIGRMAEAFDTMAEALAQKEAELRRHAGDLERGVAERTAELRGLLQAIPDLILKVGGDGRMLEYIAAKEEDLAVPPASFLGKPLAEILPSEAAQPALLAVARVLEGERVEPFDYKLTVRGEMRYFEARTSASAPDAAVILVRDVTERRRNEERTRFLARAAESLAASLDYGNTVETLARLSVPFVADICIVELLEKGRLSCVAVAGPSPDVEAVIQTARKQFPVHPASDHPVAITLRAGAPRVMSDVMPAAVDAVAQSPDHAARLGVVGVVSAILQPLSARGQVLGVMTFASTAGDRRFTETDLALTRELADRAGIAIDNARLYRELQESSRLKDEFLGVVSHELRTPLNALLGWTQVLRRGTAGGVDAARALAAIERNARAQAQLVDDLLDTSRVVSGKLRIDLVPTDVGAVVQSTVESFRPLATARGVELVAPLDPALPLVPADASRLQQVVGNLLANALKFTPSGGRVDVSTLQRGSFIEIRVRDTGSGITPDFLPYVFDRFRQADSTTTRVYGGLGIGLAIARHLVELHGGRIHVSSEGENKGATFIVELPMLTEALVERRGGGGDSPLPQLHNPAC